eukprot:TRINITY_DN23790_c0_g1_i1.p1 TRINITY_DN23790_c0_g1~~TRINITY_DN23790_c0_g1_i1.p1  ORF type:complete len:305 (+),score=39.02 TRINITY_DN23790_c0_g1_i1:90-917(+)
MAKEPDGRWCIHLRGFESWTWVSALLYSAVVGIGIYQFDGKWEHVRSSPLGPLVFERVDNNATKVVCTAEDLDTAPCYPGMVLELRYVGLVCGVLSFAPVVYSTLCSLCIAICHRRSCRTLKAVVCSAIRRWVFYCLLFVFFYAFYIVKYFAQEWARRWKPSLTFDAADHVTFSIVGLLVAFREAAWVSEESGANHVVAVGADLLAWVLVFVPRTYFTYWTVRYYHTPVESATGLAIGVLVFGCLFIRMTSSAGMCGAHFSKPALAEDLTNQLLV